MISCCGLNPIADGYEVYIPFVDFLRVRVYILFGEMSLCVCGFFFFVQFINGLFFFIVDFPIFERINIY